MAGDGIWPTAPAGHQDRSIGRPGMVVMKQTYNSGSSEGNSSSGNTRTSGKSMW